MPRSLSAGLARGKLVKPLGEGNLTRVYLARPADGPQNQPAAYVVKVLRKEWWRDSVGRRNAATRSLGWQQGIASEYFARLSVSVEDPPFTLSRPNSTAQRSPN